LNVIRANVISVDYSLFLESHKMHFCFQWKTCNRRNSSRCSEFFNTYYAVWNQAKWRRYWEWSSFYKLYQ